MTIAAKLDALEQLYALYDRFTASTPVACSKRCSTCCTTDVTVTTLEALHLWQGLNPGRRSKLERLLRETAAMRRFRPSVTTNRLAEICAAGQDPPDEGRSGSPQRCPLLVAELCSIYPLRPFHCRCMVSLQVCSESDAATMPPFTVTVNSVLLQVIEHLDTPGCSGNLLDVLALIASEDERRRYGDGSLGCRSLGLAVNRPLTVLMVPPEHRGPVAPLLEALRSIRLGR